MSKDIKNLKCNFSGEKASLSIILPLGETLYLISVSSFVYYEILDLISSLDIHVPCVDRIWAYFRMKEHNILVNNVDFLMETALPMDAYTALFIDKGSDLLALSVTGFIGKDLKAEDLSDSVVDIDMLVGEKNNPERDLVDELISVVEKATPEENSFLLKILQDILPMKEQDNADEDEEKTETLPTVSETQQTEMSPCPHCGLPYEDFVHNRYVPHCDHCYTHFAGEFEKFYEKQYGEKSEFKGTVPTSHLMREKWKALKKQKEKALQMAVRDELYERCQKLTKEIRDLTVKLGE